MSIRSEHGDAAASHPGFWAASAGTITLPARFSASGSLSKLILRRRFESDLAHTLMFSLLIDHACE